MLATGANALLRCRGPASEFRCLLTEENALELHHSGVREKERRVITGNERAARPDSMVLLFEVVEKTLSDF